MRARAASSVLAPAVDALGPRAGGVDLGALIERERAETHARYLTLYPEVERAEARERALDRCVASLEEATRVMNAQVAQQLNRTSRSPFASAQSLFASPRRSLRRVRRRAEAALLLPSRRARVLCQPGNRRFQVPSGTRGRDGVSCLPSFRQRFGRRV